MYAYIPSIDLKEIGPLAGSPSFAGWVRQTVLDGVQILPIQILPIQILSVQILSQVLSTFVTRGLSRTQPAGFAKLAQDCPTMIC